MMISDQSSRDRVAYLRQLAVDQLKNYNGGFAGLQHVTCGLDSIISSLQDVADPSWVKSLFRQWSELEIIYALKLDSGRHLMPLEEEMEVRDIVAGLLADFQGYEVPLDPEDKPEEGDVVRLRRSLPERHLKAGSQGVVVVDYARYSGGDAPLEYEVEFADPDNTTKVLSTLSVDDFEIVSRPRYGKSGS
jgi:Domain of unknown function (DUF4926)